MDKILETFKSLGDRNRLRAAMALVYQGELCVCDIKEMLGLSMATVSRHMSLLQKAGLVKNRKQGRWVHYRLSDGFPRELLGWLSQVLEGDTTVLRDRQEISGIVKNKTLRRCNDSHGTEEPDGKRRENGALNGL